MICNDDKPPRWDPYILLKGELEIQTFLGDLNQIKTYSSLFILGKGFDSRMNYFLNTYKEEIGNNKIDCTLIDFNEGSSSPSKQYIDAVQHNMIELEQIISNGDLSIRKMEMWSKDGRQSRRVSSTNAAFLFDDYKKIREYDYIIIDISSLPRSIYFAVIGKILYLIDNASEAKKPNFLIAVSENAELDANILDSGLDEFPETVHGFDSNYGLVSNAEKPLIWLPILGENKREHLSRTFQYFENPPDEICPILPFPSFNPRRSDNLLMEYHDLLFDTFLVEKQNLTYGSEQNPFEIYRKICSILRGYFRSLKIIGGCKAALSAYSSKLLSIGALLAAYELNNDYSFPVGLINIESQGYEYKDDKYLEKNNETYLIWLTGEPYEL